MPMHDWTKVEPNTYHDFHGRWIYAIRDALNRGLLPPGYYAQAEQVVVPSAPDVVTLKAPVPGRTGPRKSTGGTALATRPATAPWERAPEVVPPRRRVVILQHNSGDEIIAAIELTSPANKRSKRGFRAFVDKATGCFYLGIHLLLIDPFAPGKHDPDGMHAAVWKRYGQKPKPRPEGKSRAVSSYAVGKKVVAYLEGFNLGDPMPAMPLFLTPTKAITVPLEETYQEAWDNVPDVIRDRLLA